MISFYEIASNSFPKLARRPFCGAYTNRQIFILSSALQTDMVPFLGKNGRVDHVDLATV